MSGNSSGVSKQSLKERFSSLGKAYFAFLRMDTCLMAIISLLSVFINTFIVRASGGVNTALIYNMAAYGSQPLFMILAVIVSRKFSPRASQMLGFGFFSLLFIFIIAAGERAASEFYLVLACLRSMGAAFYYVPYSFQIIEYTTDENRDVSSGISGTISSVIALVFPFLSGLFLSLFSGSFTGYRLFFGFLLGIAALGLFFSTRLTPLKNSIDPLDSKIHLVEAFTALANGSAGRSILFMTFFKGLRLGAMSFFIEILIFSAIESESLVGLNSTVGKIFAIFGAMLYGLLITNRRRAGSVAIASTVIIAAACILFFRLDWITLMIFGAFNSGLSIFITEPELTLYFTVIATLDSLKGKAGEVHTANEFFLAAGEVAGIGLTLALNVLFPGSNVAATVTIIILTASQFACAFLIRKIQMTEYLND